MNVRVSTVSEQILLELYKEQKRTNELLEKLVPKEKPVERPANIEAVLELADSVLTGAKLGKEVMLDAKPSGNGGSSKTPRR